MTTFYFRTRQRGQIHGLGPWSPPVSIKTPDVSKLNTESQKLIPSDHALNMCFGWSGALSRDGTTLIVGAYLDNTPLTDTGSAYIFTKGTDGLFKQTAKLVPKDRAAYDGNGRSVDISADGKTAIVGAFQDDDKGVNSGSAYIFELIDGLWTETAKLVAIDGQRDDFFGYTVSISGDGKTVFIGSPQDDDQGSASGSGYLFIKEAATWTLISKFLPPNLGTKEYYGIVADLSHDGKTLLVGAHRYTSAYLNQGRCYVYDTSSGSWARRAILNPSAPSYNANFGQCLAISDDAKLIFVGAYRDNGTRGCVDIFEKVDATWTHQQKLVSSDVAVSDNFGVSLSISSDGSVLVVGACLASPIDKNSGAAYVYRRDGALWTNEVKLVPSDGLKYDNFGRAVSVSGNGRLAAITATALTTNTVATYLYT